jgi:peptide/nickel transport system substrate-binding protein
MHTRAEHSQVSRRAALRLLAGTCLTGLLAACAAPQPSTPAAGNSSPPTAAASSGSTASVSQAGVSSTPASQPRPGGTLRTANSSDIATLDPFQFSSNATDTTWLAFDRLISYDENLVPQPMLAESWDVSSDHTQFKFNLRKGVTYHTGRDFTSDDVKYTMTRAKDPKVGNGIISNLANWFTSVDTPDKYTVVVHSDAARPGFFDALDVMNIGDKETLEGPDAKTKVVGTGPFMLTDRVQGDHFTLVKNPNYWIANRPYLDGILANIRTQDNMASQLEAGVLDMVKTPLLQDYVRLKDDPKYTVGVATNTGTYYEIGIHTTVPPFDDKRVRQAMSYALDRKRFTDVIFHGIASPLNLPWSPSCPAYDAAKNTTYAYDLDKARSLLKDAGVSSIETDIMVPGAIQPPLLEFVQVYQQDLATLGVKANIKNLDNTIMFDRINSNSPEYTGFYSTSDNWSSMTPGTIFSLSTAWRLMNNGSKFSSDTYTSLAGSMASETDPAKQKQTYDTMNDYMLDQSFVMIISTYPTTYITTAKVHGIEFLRHLSAFSFTNAWMDQ